MSGYRFLWERRWITAIVALLVFAVLCHVLAQWQLARRAEARAEIARVLANYDAVPVSIDALLPGLSSYREADKWRPVELTGSYRPDLEVLVRNRPCAGAAGYNVVTPFELTSGPLVFVDRGCVPAGSNANTAADYRPVDSGATTIEVRLRASEPRVNGRDDSAGAVGSINAPALAERTGMPSYTGAYGQLVAPEGGTAPFAPARPVPDEGPHLSYAFQWYVFVGIAATGYVWSARNERRNRLSDAADAVADLPGPATDSQQPEQAGQTASTAARLSKRYGVAGAGGRFRRSGAGHASDTELEDALIDGEAQRSGPR
ncbi:MAG TPA: SURF1 family protein [Microbacteriaceae bacterium]|nr:SURF1 family protein [Microbacteriaceae bacterium]